MKEKNKTVPFLDLRITNTEDRQKLLNVIEKVMTHGRFIMGPEVELLEEKIAAYIDMPYAICVNSGTDALYLALRSVGVGPGDEVITTALSWIATANAIALCGATPVFADISDDLNIDPASVASLITKKTKAIMPVHYTGKVCDMYSLNDIANRYDITVIEDASQAFGASLYGKRAGSYGDLSCFSLNPMKVFGALGEAGVILTRSSALQQRLISLRYNGMENREVCHEPSLNGRIDTLQAAILLVRLDSVETTIEKRNAIAQIYNNAISEYVITPCIMKDERHAFYTYTIQTDDRKKLIQYLEEAGIEVKIRDSILMPNQPAYKTEIHGKLTNSERIINRLLSIPIHEKMTEKDAVYVTNSIIDFFRS